MIKESAPETMDLDFRMEIQGLKEGYAAGSLKKSTEEPWSPMTDRKATSYVPTKHKVNPWRKFCFKYQNEIIVVFGAILMMVWVVVFFVWFDAWTLARNSYSGKCKLDGYTTGSYCNDCDLRLRALINYDEQHPVWEERRAESIRDNGLTEGALQQYWFEGRKNLRNWFIRGYRIEYDEFGDHIAPKVEVFQCCPENCCDWIYGFAYAKKRVDLTSATTLTPSSDGESAAQSPTSVVSAATTDSATRLLLSEPDSEPQNGRSTTAVKLRHYFGRATRHYFANMNFFESNSNPSHLEDARNSAHFTPETTNGNLSHSIQITPDAPSESPRKLTPVSYVDHCDINPPSPLPYWLEDYPDFKCNSKPYPCTLKNPRNFDAELGATFQQERNGVPLQDFLIEFSAVDQWIFWQAFLIIYSLVLGFYCALVAVIFEAEKRGIPVRRLAYQFALRKQADLRRWIIRKKKLMWRIWLECHRQRRILTRRCIGRGRRVYIEITEPYRHWVYKKEQRYEMAMRWQKLHEYDMNYTEPPILCPENFDLCDFLLKLLCARICRRLFGDGESEVTETEEEIRRQEEAAKGQERRGMLWNMSDEAIKISLAGKRKVNYHYLPDKVPQSKMAATTFYASRIRKYYTPGDKFDHIALLLLDSDDIDIVLSKKRYWKRNGMKHPRVSKVGGALMNMYDIRRYDALYRVKDLIITTENWNKADWERPCEVEFIRIATEWLKEHPKRNYHVITKVEKKPVVNSKDEIMRAIKHTIGPNKADYLKAHKINFKEYLADPAEKRVDSWPHMTYDVLPSAFAVTKPHKDRPLKGNEAFFIFPKERRAARAAKKKFKAGQISRSASKFSRTDSKVRFGDTIVVGEPIEIQIKVDRTSVIEEVD